MVQKLWVPESRKTTVCVDSYQDSVFQGRVYIPGRDAQPFSSMCQFLVLIEDLLDQTNIPQSDTTRRSFSTLLQPNSTGCFRDGRPRGTQATFELQILFRQHTSWQGTIVWKDQHKEQSFRSVLELILLMDSALRGLTEKEVG